MDNNISIFLKQVELLIVFCSCAIFKVSISYIWSIYKLKSRRTSYFISANFWLLMETHHWLWFRPGIHIVYGNSLNHYDLRGCHQHETSDLPVWYLVIQHWFDSVRYKIHFCVGIMEIIIIETYGYWC